MPVIVAISLMLLLVIPAGAVSIRHIDITVAENGDALIAADYSLNWAEQAIVYPAAVPLLLGALGKNIQVHSFSPDKTQLTVQHLVTVSQTRALPLTKHRPSQLPMQENNLTSTGLAT